jgi:hypothetical protein
MSITILKRYRPQETYEVRIRATGADATEADRIVVMGNGRALGGGEYDLVRRGAATLKLVSGGQ